MFKATPINFDYASFIWHTPPSRAIKCSHVQEVSPLKCLEPSFFSPPRACVCDCRFTASESVSGSSQAKASVVRGIRAKLSEQYPQLADYIDDIIPKKEPIHILKWYRRANTCILRFLIVFELIFCSHDHIEILVRKNELLLFRQRDGPYIPTLRLLHKCEG